MHTTRIEVIISDNNSTDETEKVAEEFIAEYGNKVRYFKNEQNVVDLNFDLALSRGCGNLLKLNNDTQVYRNGSLAKILRIVDECIKTKPIIFFSNRSLYRKHPIPCNGLDEFISYCSYTCTWIGGFTIWKEHYRDLNDFNRFASLKLTQTDVVFRMVNARKIALIYPEKLFTMTPINRGGYNFFEIFINNYTYLIKNHVTDGTVRRKTLKREEQKLLYKFVCRWVAKSTVGYRSTFDISESNDYIRRHFGKNYARLALYRLLLIFYIIIYSTTNIIKCLLNYFRKTH